MGVVSFHSCILCAFQLTYSGFPVGEEVTVPVVDLSEVKVEGLETDLQANREAEFVVDATAAGPGDLAVEVKDANGDNVPTQTEALAPHRWNVK